MRDTNQTGLELRKSQIIEPILYSEKTCSICRKSKPATTEYFHKSSRHLYGFDARCKLCVSAQKRHANPKPKTYAEQLAGIDRSTIKGFTKYMTANPCYFKYAFHQEATPHNIERAFYEVVNP